MTYSCVKKPYQWIYIFFFFLKKFHVLKYHVVFIWMVFFIIILISSIHVHVFVCMNHCITNRFCPLEIKSWFRYCSRVVPKDEYSTSIATKRSDPCHVSPVPSKRKSCCVSIFLYGVGSLVCVPFLYIIEDHVSFTTKELFFFFWVILSRCISKANLCLVPWP